MAEEVMETQLNSDNSTDGGHFESTFDHNVSSTDEKRGSSNTEGSQRTSTVVDDADKLSDRQVLEAVNKLLKVCNVRIMSHFACSSILSSIYFPR